MSLVRLEGVARYYGAQHVLGPLDLQVQAGERIGLIGPNGSGKTTLLELLAGAEPDEGRVLRAKSARIAYLKQEHRGAEGESLVEYVAHAFDHLNEVEQRLRRLEERMGDPAVQGDPDELEGVMAAYTQTLAAFEEGGGYEREARLRGALFGLGLSESDFDRPFASLSGGQKARASLARTLLTHGDLLLLDEPTNHLDLEATAWLERFLQKYPKGFLVVSHDRYFLDALVEKVWEIEGTQVVEYKGNYTTSRARARERRERLRKVYEANREERARLEAYVERYRAGNRAAQAKSRERRLDRMEEAPPPPPEAPTARFRVRSTGRSERRVCTFEEVSLGFASPPIFERLSLEIERGERIGIAGPNGAGKSTLLRAIAGELSPLAGAIHMGRAVRKAYFAQDRIDLDPERTVLNEILEEKRQLLSEARSFLARFLFRGDDVFKRVSELSGGEKSRLALAKLLLHGGNLLLLDEPTNHLDIGMREALQEALEGYDGTLLFITHDRALLEALAGKVWWVESGEIRVFKGGYAALAEWLAAREPERGTARQGGEHPTEERGSSRPKRPREPGRSRERERMERRLAEVEVEIEALTSERAEVETELAAPDTYSDPAKVEALSRRHAELAEELAALEEEWGELVEALSAE